MSLMSGASTLATSVSLALSSEDICFQQCSGISNKQGLYINWLAKPGWKLPRAEETYLTWLSREGTHSLSSQAISLTS